MLIGFYTLIRRLARVVIAMVIFASLFGATDNIAAQTPPLSVFRGDAGSYSLSVSVVPDPPIVGNVHFNIEPVDPTTNQPVTDAIIRLVASSSDGEKKVLAVALNTPQIQDVYASNIKFRLAQEWIIDLEIESPSLGSTTATFQIEIGDPPSPPQNTGAGLLLLGVFLAIVGGTAYLIFSSRRKLRNR